MSIKNAERRRVFKILIVKEEVKKNIEKEIDSFKMKEKKNYLMSNQNHSEIFSRPHSFKMSC